MTREQVLNDIQVALQEAGVDMAHYSYHESETKEFNVDGGEFSLFRTLFDKSLSLTVYKDQKMGRISTNQLTKEAIDEAIHTALAAAESGVEDVAYALYDKQPETIFHEGSAVCDTEKLFARTEEFKNQIQEEFPKIMVMQMVVRHTASHTVYGNTNGTRFVYDNGKYSFDLTFAGHEGEKTTSLCGADMELYDLDKQFIENGEIRKQLEDAEAQLHEVPVNGKVDDGILILSPGCLYGFLEDAFMNFAGDNALIAGTSIWKDKLGEQVADCRISIANAPLDEEVVCGERFTAEGAISKNYDWIKDGVLKSFGLTLYGANKSGQKPAANTAFCPMMEAGDVSLDEIVKNTKKGLVMGRFSGGMPASNGDFSGIAKNSFYVENGEIKGAASEVMVSGNLAEILQNVVAISKERNGFGQGLVPYLAVKGVTIAGK